MHVSVYQVKLALLKAKFILSKQIKNEIEKTLKGPASKLLD